MGVGAAGDAPAGGGDGGKGDENVFVGFGDAVIDHRDVEGGGIGGDVGGQGDFGGGIGAGVTIGGLEGDIQAAGGDGG